MLTFWILCNLFFTYSHNSGNYSEFATNLLDTKIDTTQYLKNMFIMNLFKSVL